MAALALAGCGESSAEKNAKALREDNRSIHTLNESTRETALSDVEVERAKLAHGRALRLLRLTEQAVREGRPAPRNLPTVEERVYRHKDRRLAATEQWIRAGAHPPGPAEAP